MLCSLAGFLCFFTLGLVVAEGPDLRESDASVFTEAIAAALTGKDVCSGSWKKTCDTGFEPESPAVFGKSNSGVIPAANGHASLVLKRWKCVCKTCASRRRSQAVCQTKCTRGKDTDVVKYYNFLSAHCTKAAMSATTKTKTIEKTQSLFMSHNKEKFQDMLEPLVLAPAPPSPKRPTCSTDVKKCVDFAFNPNAGCTFASVRQISALMRAGPDGYKSLTDYMQKRAQAHGLPDDCVLGVFPRLNYSPVGKYPWPLPDNRKGRYYIVGGVPPTEAKIREYGAGLKDAVNTMYPTIQFQGFRSPGTPKTRSCMNYWSTALPENKATNYRGRAALQIRLCKGGKIEGVTHVAPLHTMDKKVMSRMCRGKATAPKIENIFREAVAYARFQLARKWKDVDERSGPCSKGQWDGMRCMNSMFPSTSQAQCYLVDITSVRYHPSCNWKCRKDNNKSPFLYLRFINDGSFNHFTWADGCSDGNVYSGKCTVRVCNDNLRVEVPEFITVSLRWNYNGRGVTKRNLVGTANKRWIKFNWDGNGEERRPTNCIKGWNRWGEKACQTSSTPTECPTCAKEWHITQECVK